MARQKHPKRANGSFLSLPHHLIRHPNFGDLSGNAVKLLIELIKEHNGFNNGDFSAPFSKLKDRGWKSKGTLSRAIKELLDSRFIIKTRQGGKHKCSLYGFTLWGIDECDGKLEVRHSKSPSNEWKN
jgi:hypothetical protein